jgi:GNAT superfamily N-acetyltransferase
MELRAVQACLCAGIESRSITVGPFSVLIHAESGNPFLNYAVPAEGAAPTTADVAALVGFFRERDRLPRLEYVRPVPAVDTPLVDAGFDVAPTLTLMALGEFTAPEVPAGVDVRLVDGDADLRAAVAVQNTAYGDPDPAADRLGLPRIVRRGGGVALATADDGQPVGSGLFPPPRHGLVEVLGVGVLAGHRRRGIARALAAALTAAALERGHEPFLQVEKDEPLRIYERLGYRVIGTMADARLTRG